MANPPVVLYRYDGSPFATKISYILTIKGISHKTVDVSMILPRPQITELLGIQYRRIPILAIGNDVYCDTSLIASALERRFPAKAGFGTLFPVRKGTKATDIGLQKAFTLFYTDRPLFGLTASTIPWATFTPDFLKDRSAFNGRQIDPQVMISRQPAGISVLASHVSLAEQQLSDGREYFFDTVSPSLTDIAVFFNYSWITQHEGVNKVLDTSRFPYFMKWFALVEKYIQDKKKKVKVEKIDGKTAADIITKSSAESVGIVGFDEREAALLKVKKGSPTSVTPEDTGASHPTTGKLLAINQEEVVLEVQGTAGQVAVHLPRLVFSVTPAPQTKL